MTFLRCVYRALQTNRLLREQNDELHGRIRVLEAELECVKRINNRNAEDLFEARDMLLEHSYHCLPSWGDSR